MERPSLVIQEQNNSEEDSLKVNKSFEGTSTKTLKKKNKNNQ